MDKHMCHILYILLNNAEPSASYFLIHESTLSRDFSYTEKYKIALLNVFYKLRLFKKSISRAWT